jgi:hypothetical protein
LILSLYRQTPELNPATRRASRIKRPHLSAVSF